MYDTAAAGVQENNMSDKQPEIVEMSVGDLEVLAYVPDQCPENHWRIIVLPVTKCAYYLSAKNGDRHAYEEYVALMVNRDGRTVPRYEEFLEQVDQLRADGGYRNEKVGKFPMTIYKGTKWLKDGHHRAAIFCAHFGPAEKVMVEIADVKLPGDLNQCFPCEP